MKEIKFFLIINLIIFFILASIIVSRDGLSSLSYNNLDEWKRVLFITSFFSLIFSLIPFAINEAKEKFRDWKHAGLQGSSTEQDTSLRPQETEKRKMGKVGMVIGTAAYLKASRHPRIPIVTPRDYKTRILQVQHVRGDTYLVHYMAQGLVSVIGGGEQPWKSETREINPSISGFSAGGAGCDVRWR